MNAMTMILADLNNAKKMRFAITKNGQLGLFRHMVHLNSEVVNQEKIIELTFVEEMIFGWKTRYMTGRVMTVSKGHFPYLIENPRSEQLLVCGIGNIWRTLISPNPSSIYSWFLKPLSVLHSRFPTKKSWVVAYLKIIIFFPSIKIYIFFSSYATF